MHRVTESRASKTKFRKVLVHSQTLFPFFHLFFKFILFVFVYNKREIFWEAVPTSNSVCLGVATENRAEVIYHYYLRNIGSPQKFRTSAPR